MAAEKSGDRGRAKRLPFHLSCFAQALDRISIPSHHHHFLRGGVESGKHDRISTPWQEVQIPLAN
jgi:hypothetical protein